MKAELLFGYFNGNISAMQFFGSIVVEAQEWAKLLCKRGSSAPIFLEPVDAGCHISEVMISRILDDTISQAVGLEVLSYVLDCLTIAPSITWDSVRTKDLVENAMLSSAILSMDNVRALRSSLS